MGEVEPFVVHEDHVAVEGGDGGDFGSVTWRTLISGDRTPTGSLTVGVAEVPPGDADRAGPHRHAPAEIYYVLAGEGIMRIGDVEHPLRPGSTVFVPANAWHVAHNTGTGQLRILYAFATDSFGDVVYEFPPDGG